MKRKMGAMSSDGKLCVLFIFFFMLFCVAVIVFAEPLNLYSSYLLCA